MAVKKQALIVGNNYAGSRYELPGSVSTAKEWEKRLRALGFSVIVRIEGNAKRALLAHAIRTMFSRATGQGDVIVIVWCGHGMELNFDGQIIRALVPWDAVMPVENWNLTIPTYQISALLAQRPPHARLFTCFDTCFSGGFRKAGEETLVPQFIPRKTVRKKIPDFGEIEIRGKMPVFGAIFGGSNNYVSFHPCAEDQISYQSRFVDQWYGVFSKCIFDNFKAGTYSKVFSAAKARQLKLTPGAVPEWAGDPALMKKPFLT